MGTSKTRKLILYIATSLDGYIAAPGDDLNFLSIVAKEGEDYGYHDFIQTIDTVLIGRRTYDWVIKQVDFPHRDKETYVITKTPQPSIGKVNFYTGDLKELVTALKAKEGKNIFCDGGAQIIHSLLKENLVDHMIISIVPVLLGDGIKLFNDGRPGSKLKLVSSKSFETGLVQLHYSFL